MSTSSKGFGKANLANSAIRQCPIWWLGVAFAFGIVGAIADKGTPTLAQITPDATLGAEGSIITPNVNVRGFPAQLIQGGATRGANLFHSFSDFNVGAGQRVYFANPAGIETILTRVTGNTLSNILGTLGVTGRADLILLNPNGIIFGSNARLDVGGSFFATTANAVQFDDQGFFRVTNPQAPGLLTIKPTAFFFNQPNAGTIKNRSVARNPVVPSFIEGLRVPNGESLVLLGGNVNIERGQLNAFGGRVEIGAVAGTGTVGLNADGSLNFPTDVQRADVSFTNGARVDVSFNNGGDIAITARNISISGESSLLAGINSRLSSVNSRAGDIMLNATDTIWVESSSAIRNDVRSNSTGRGGNLKITTGSLFVVGNSLLTARTSGNGDAGSVIINARDRVVLSGDDTTTDSRVSQTGRGKGGDVRISTNTLELLDGAQLITVTLGIGDAGSIVIEARDRVSFTGNNRMTSTSSNTGAFSSVGGRLGGNPIRNVQGKGGDIRISTNILELTNGAQLSSGTYGIGDAGDIVIEASDRAQISARSGSTGDAGRVEITAEAVRLNNSDITTSAEQAAGGAISIKADSLSLNRGRITAATGTNGAQNAANITLQGLDLLLMGNESLISANALNQANGGNVTIDSRFIVATPPQGSEGSDITANAFRGNGGRVSVNTQGLFGIQFRPLRTPKNDITVSSEFGLAGVYQQSTPGIDPTRGLAELPTDVVDASRQIDRRCSPNSSARQSSFTVTGRGGLPPSPNDPLQPETVTTNWVILDSKIENKTPPDPTTIPNSAPRQLVEAQGWVINEKGQVVLTANTPAVIPNLSGLRELNCTVSSPGNVPES